MLIQVPEREEMGGVPYRLAHYGMTSLRHTVRGVREARVRLTAQGMCNQDMSGQH